jgi:bifunctional UDP-N-acetylglucosamine pyrophosphorylase/glucosamine-1-phosphate N-acetyltransferase
VKAVILAAGEGQRMRPLTYTRPKVMLPIANKPILEHLLIEVARAGIDEFVLVVGYHDEQVRNYFGNGDRWGVKVEYATQRKQMGTADALRMVEGMVDGSFLMINGDIIIDYEDIGKLLSRKGGVMSIIEVGDTSELGVVEVSGEEVVHIYEKMEQPVSRLANAGLYLFTPDIFGTVSKTPRSPRGEYYLTDSIQLLIDEGHPVSYHKIEFWLDLSYPWDMLPANEFLLSGLESENLGKVEENVVLKDPVQIGQGTVVRSGSYIVGPVKIGENCDIGPSCYIRPHTSIGNNCHIGSAVEVKNSVIMNSSKIPHHNYVGDSVIGEGCNLGAGTKIANLRFDGVQIKVAGKETGRRKLGAIMGDHVETGINSCINIGTVIGNNAQVGPGALVRGVISPNSKIL